MNQKFNTIKDALEDIKQGKIIIVVDDEDRENEGDFIMAGELVTPETVNFMAKEGRGLICVSITPKRAEELDLNLMVANNTSSHTTNFTVSVDHLPTNTTGISVFDRANTIKAIADDKTKPSELMRPGHIFPLVTKKGGVLRRAGHTEASSDLAKLAGLKPVGVLCEIMNDDGSMSRVPDLWKIAEKHNLKMITIKDLIQYSINKEIFVNMDSKIEIPTKWGDFELVTFINKHDPTEHHIAFVKGDISDGKPVLVRVHSECLTGDVFGSGRCDCGEQLDFAMQRIAKEGRGAVLYLRQEGRGIGFPAKMKSYELQERGFDTVEANLKLGFKPDLRDYGFGAQMIHLLGIKKVRLMTNNPRKIIGLEGFDIKIVERVPIEIQSKSTNIHYLQTKRDKLGHEILK
ncbi:MAG: bifunctional 3,4-dihydroxy-2-butanone-4-phosphate synthase/GTP cyclohydrolase II [Candidatus Sericytochromatia bacterium]|nr:bifunctional 3,4-dihydroxy-2-butanone-4-phosphate synthase/GTP cyclohydrolase II [Candidatus Sericytochromatia bacterium]